MRLLLTINGVETHIDILAPAPGCRFQMGHSAQRNANVETPEPGVYSVLMDGRSYDACVEETAAGLVVSVRGFRFEIEARDPRRWSRKSTGGGGAGVQTITSTMPGKVVRVLVAPGGAVDAGQGLVVVEAMKMQNEMKAVRGGKVLRVAVKDGDTVTAGEVLVTIE
jgi:biotin carboxyl carrier protein